MAILLGLSRFHLKVPPSKQFAISDFWYLFLVL